MPRNFTSPVGRLVQGDVFEPQLTNQQGAPRVVLQGPRAGQPNPQWFVALAFAKTDPAWPPFKAELDAEAAASWPSLFPQGARGPCVLATFSNKIIDGDGFDTTGKSNATKEGFAGHWIVRFTSGFAPKAWKETSPGSQTFVEITDHKEIKRGYYARVSGSTISNQNPTKPGIHVNLGMVQLVGQGPEIISGPSAAEAFAAPAALPPGATPPPVSAAPLPGGGAPPPPAPAAAPPPPPAAAPAPAPAAYTGYMPGAAPARVMLPAAAGQTYEALIAANWTDALLIQHGYMAAPAAAPPPPPVAPAAPSPPPAPLAPAAAPPPPPGKPPIGTMTAKAAGQTREAMIAANWTDALLVQHGHMEDYIPF